MSGDRYVAEDNTNDITKIRTKPCWICGQYSYIEVPCEAWRLFDLYDVPLDVAWPQGSAEDKQRILTGIHPKCWTAEYPDDTGEGA